MPIQRRIPGYDLEMPTGALIVESLARYVDDEEAEALWTAAKAAANLPADTDRHPPQELLRALEYLDEQGPLAATCAKGLRIRVRSYMVLADARTPAPAAD